jgi:lysophospholipase L1-like esterase
MKIFILLTTLCLCLRAEKSLYPLTDLFAVSGALYTKMNGEYLEFRRFPEEFAKIKASHLGFNLKKAETSSGVCLHFKSNSEHISLQFVTIPDDENRDSDFALHVDNLMDKTWSFSKKDDININIINPSGKWQSYRLILPSLSNPMLKSIKIDNNATLKADNSKKKKKYLAIGDSITHGVGQDSKSYKTYAFKLAQKLDLELYNLAVGGGKISPAISGIIKDFKNIGMITLLIGYNDWQHQGKTLEEFANSYNDFLNETRAAFPHVKIFCISLLYSNTEKSKKSGLKADTYRILLEQIINQRRKNSDKNIHFIAGDSISSKNNLRPNSSDPVHLGIQGAEMLACELFKKIVPKLSK